MNLFIPLLFSIVRFENKSKSQQNQIYFSFESIVGFSFISSILNETFMF